MVTLRRLRLLATAVLALAVLLPSYTCAGYVAPDGKTTLEIPKGADSSRYRPTRIVHHPLDEQSPREAGFWIVLATYGWPLVLLAASRRARSRVARRSVAVAQALLALGSGYLIFAWASVGDWAVGTYLAQAADAALLAVALAELWRLRRPTPELHDRAATVDVTHADA